MAPCCSGDTHTCSANLQDIRLCTSHRARAHRWRADTSDMLRGRRMSSTCASDHMLRLLISSTFGCDVEASSFIGSPSGLKTRTSAPSRSRILQQQRFVGRISPCRQRTWWLWNPNSAVKQPAGLGRSLPSNNMVVLPQRSGMMMFSGRTVRTRRPVAWSSFAAVGSRTSPGPSKAPRPHLPCCELRPALRAGPSRTLRSHH